MSWLLLIVAGLLEVGWATALPSTQGLTRLGPTVVFLGLLAGSMFLLAKATEEIPIGTAYGVWVGIGAVGAAVVGMVADGDPATPVRIGLLAMLIAAIVGLKVTGSE